MKNGKKLGKELKYYKKKLEKVQNGSIEHFV
jgi:hypothetical protein